jgi:hypothetical protein
VKGRFNRPIWIVPLAIAALVAGVGWWGNIRLRETVEGQLRAKLLSTLDANVTALEIWTTNQIRLATSLADEPEVRIRSARILAHSLEDPGEGRRGGELPDMDELNSYLRPRVTRMGYETVQLVNTNFVVAANLGRGRAGAGRSVSDAQTARFAELFETQQPILITPFKPEIPAFRRPPGRSPNAWRGPDPGFRPRGTNDFQRRRGDITLMQVAAPITDASGMRGALALVIDPDREFSRILSVARSGESGETYAFDQTGLLISRSRFDDQLRDLGLLAETNASSALNLRLYDPGGDLTQGFNREDADQRPLIHIVASAVSEASGIEVQPSRDYRGVPVVGAWRWLPDLGFGVATQIDATEAYRPLRVLQWVFIVLFLLLVLCAIAMFLFSYSSVTWQRRLGEAELKLKQLGQYTLEEKIGEGGMGVVYRARHALMRRDTAVKLLLPDRANDDSIQRFEREVCLTCQLTHPNTIQVYDYGHTPEGIFYYAMELLRGVNLHHLVARFGPQPEGRVAHILIQVCESLAEAHTLGLVHRDIKPANVFLCNRAGIPDCVKVLDFGLIREYRAGASNSQATRKETFVGTPSFMAPESVKNPTKSDPRSDIYSVAAVGYFLLTGTRPFAGDGVAEIYEQQLTTNPERPGLRTSNVISVEMEDLILRCLDRKPENRPQTAGELRSLLLNTPRVFESNSDTRAAWWAKFGDQASELGDAGTTTNSAPTVKIDFASRMK